MTFPSVAAVDSKMFSVQRVFTFLFIVGSFGIFLHLFYLDNVIQTFLPIKLITSNKSLVQKCPKVSPKLSKAVTIKTNNNS